MAKILIFSPYALWGIHTIYERTIAQACQVRSAQLEYLLCDGLLPECDMHWDSKAGGPRPSDICQRCQAMAKDDTGRVDIPSRQMGSLVGEEERAAIFAWARSLRPTEFQSASFQGLPLGEWVQSSVIAYFRKYPPDLEDWHVASVYGGFLYSAALVATCLRIYLAQNQVDSALLFNGRQSIMRVALEIFRQNGIRVLTHERAEFHRGHINLKPNAHCMSLAPFLEFWKDWSRVPLTRPELKSAERWLTERQTGVNLAWIPFNRSFELDPLLRAKMGLHQGQKLWVLFTSSTDETAGDPGMKGPFDSQHQWIQEVVEWVARRSEIQLVIKVHPNLGGNVYIGAATGELQFYKGFVSTLPPNVKIIFPEDAVNTYALAGEADVGLTFGSTIGLEMAMLGKPVLLASRACYEDCAKVMVVRQKEELPDLLEECLTASSNREIQREAFRLAYSYVFRFEMPFNALRVTGIYDAKATYNEPSDLAAGKDATLDHACTYLIEGGPLFDEPTAEQLAASTDEEDAFFNELRGEKNADEIATSARTEDIVELPKRTHITVVLCTYNRCERLAKALQSVAASRLPKAVEWEVLVIDNNSKDQTKAVTEEFCSTYPGHFRYLFEGRQGKSFALNLGIQEASGDVIAFMDDDVVVEPDWMQNITAPLLNAAYMATGGRICAPKDVSLPAWVSLEEPISLAGVLALFDRGPKAIELVEDAPYGTNMAFRKEAFGRFGAFRTDLGPCVGSEIRGEDTEFCWRLLKAGVPVLYVPDAVVYHDVPKNRLRRKYFLTWFFDYGRAFIRQRDRSPDIWIIPRPILGAMNHMLFMLPKKLVRWLFTFGAQERFYALTRVWMTVGEAAELYHQWKVPEVSREGMKSEAVVQE